MNQIFGRHFFARIRKNWWLAQFHEYTIFKIFLYHSSLIEILFCRKASSIRILPINIQRSRIENPNYAWKTENIHSKYTIFWQNRKTQLFRSIQDQICDGIWKNFERSLQNSNWKSFSKSTRLISTSIKFFFF